MFDRLTALAGFWTVLGLYGDLSWHIRHHVDSFFTVQHAVLYSGLIALFATAAFARYKPQRQVLLSGIALFALGGVLDLLKHQLFGIEHDFDAVVSPTHLLIGLGVALAISAPLRSRALRTSLAGQLPAIVAIAMIAELLHWVSNPFFRFNAAAAYATPLPHQLTTDALTIQTLHVYEQGGGLIAALLQALFVTATLLYASRKLTPAPGAFTVLSLFSTLFVAIAVSTSATEIAVALAAALACGCAADVLYARLGARWPYAFAWASALVFNAVVIAGTAATAGIWWDASFTAGVIAASTLFAFFFATAAEAPLRDHSPH